MGVSLAEHRVLLSFARDDAAFATRMGNLMTELGAAILPRDESILGLGLHPCGTAAFRSSAQCSPRRRQRASRSACRAARTPAHSPGRDFTRRIRGTPAPTASWPVWPRLPSLAALSRHLPDPPPEASGSERIIIVVESLSSGAEFSAASTWLSRLHQPVRLQTVTEFVQYCAAQRPASPIPI